MAKRTVYRVDGMVCAACADVIASAVRRALPGLDVSVSHREGRLTVEGEADKAALKKAVESAGFGFGGRT
jgi:copper chaperone CopZ